MSQECPHSLVQREWRYLAGAVAEMRNNAGNVLYFKPYFIILVGGTNIPT
jgi:hypothetical protein